MNEKQAGLRSSTGPKKSNRHGAKSISLRFKGSQLSSCSHLAPQAGHDILPTVPERLRLSMKVLRQRAFIQYLASQAKLYECLTNRIEQDRREHDSSGV